MAVELLIVGLKCTRTNNKWLWSSRKSSTNRLCLFKIWKIPSTHVRQCSINGNLVFYIYIKREYPQYEILLLWNYHRNWKSFSTYGFNDFCFDVICLCSSPFGWLPRQCNLIPMRIMSSRDGQNNICITNQSCIIQRKNHIYHRRTSAEDDEGRR